MSDWCCVGYTPAAHLWLDGAHRRPVPGNSSPRHLQAARSWAARASGKTIVCHQDGSSTALKTGARVDVPVPHSHGAARTAANGTRVRGALHTEENGSSKGTADITRVTSPQFWSWKPPPGPGSQCSSNLASCLAQGKWEDFWLHLKSKCKYTINLA